MENFTIGLIFHRDNESDICLARYNGNHGFHKNFITGEIIKGCHIHRATLATIEMGIPENQAEATNKYSTLKKAMPIFFTDLMITNYTDYYPEFLQPNLGLSYDE